MGKNNPPPQIQAVEYEFVENDSPNSFDYDYSGTQFYTSISLDDDSSNYLRIRAIETWRYNACYGSVLDYDREIKQHVRREPRTHVCWLTQEHNDYFIFDASEFSSNIISRLPINFIDNVPIRYRNGYSLNILVESLTTDAYGYWQALAQNNAEAEAIADRQPFNLPTNLSSQEQTNVSIAGFFSAVGVSKKRAFIQASEFPNDYHIPPSLPCSQFCRLIFPPAYRLPSGVVVEDTLAYLEDQGYEYAFALDSETFFYSTRECTDCRLQGGTIVKPVYWLP